MPCPYHADMSAGSLAPDGLDYSVTAPFIGLTISISSRPTEEFWLFNLAVDVFAMFCAMPRATS